MNIQLSLGTGQGSEMSRDVAMGSPMSGTRKKAIGAVL